MSLDDRLAPNEVAFVAARHWSGEDLRTSVAIAFAESLGDPYALGYSKKLMTVDGVQLECYENVDLGLFQISNKWHTLNGDGTPGKLLLVGAEWRDPYVNADLAKKVFDERARTGNSGWTAWATFNSGSYKKFLPLADYGIRGPWAPPIFDKAVATEIGKRLKEASVESPTST